MKTITRKQRIALFLVYNRKVMSHCPTCKQEWERSRTQSYRQFRRTVTNLNGTLGCIMVPWEGMVLGIEKDGHTHS